METTAVRVAMAGVEGVLSGCGGATPAGTVATVAFRCDRALGKLVIHFWNIFETERVGVMSLEYGL